MARPASIVNRPNVRDGSNPVVSIVRRSLPIYPGKQTSSKPVGTSEKCQTDLPLMTACGQTRDRFKEAPKIKISEASEQSLSALDQSGLHRKLLGTSMLI
jgi:hypothetical protein